MSTSYLRRALRAAVLLLPILFATACGEVYSHEDFTKAVMGKSEQEVSKQFGKPASVDASNPQRVIWTYTHVTFDLEKQNTRDPKTMVIFEQKPGATPKVTKVEFG